MMAGGIMEEAREWDAVLYDGWHAQQEEEEEMHSFAVKEEARDEEGKASGGNETKTPVHTASSSKQMDTAASPLVSLENIVDRKGQRVNMILSPGKMELLEKYEQKADGLERLKPHAGSATRNEDAFLELDWEKERAHILNPSLGPYKVHFTDRQESRDADTENAWWSAQESAASTKLSMAEARLLRKLKRDPLFSAIAET